MGSSRPTVAIGTLGGTITMVATEGEAGVLPRLGADELVAAVPQLADHSLRVATLGTLPGASLLEGDVHAAVGWAEEQVRDGAAGVVLVQGTDTLEETSYLADLRWGHSAPLVFTGAMRAPHLAGADGPANLLAAVGVAASPEAADRGVLVVLDDEVHAASRVCKRDSSAVSAFASPSFGPLGRVVEGRVRLPDAPRPRLPPLPAPADEGRPEVRVALLTTHLGDDGRLLDLAVADGYDGVVLAALGVGHVSQRFAEAVSRAVDRVPVVFASRTGAGSTWTGTYGFTGSERDLLARGALGAGWLSAPKARVLLSHLLALGLPAEEVAVEVARRGEA